MEIMGELQRSVKMYSKGRDEVIEVWWKGSLWVLLIEQSEQRVFCVTDWVKGKEKEETTFLRME